MDYKRFPPSFRGLLILAIAGIATACSPSHKAEDGKPPATVAPLGFAKTNDDAQVALNLPEPIKLYPDLHTRLYNEGQASLTAFLDQAHKARAEQSADGMDTATYSRTITWKIAAQSPRFVSLYAEEDQFEGGAHPNSSFQALLWDKDRNDLIQTTKLFMPGADLKGIDDYVCHQIEAARSRRAGQPMTQAASGYTCPKFADSRLILIPSTEAGKIGAIDALYAPYDVGAYAEGPYEVRVPQTLLKGLIRPDFADQFAGQPVSGAALPDPDAQNDQAP